MYRCKKWTFEDCAKKLPLRSMSNKAFHYVKDELQIPSPGRSTLDKEFKFMHVAPGWITSTFEYLKLKSPTWSEKDTLASICCDELYINGNTDVDLILDMALNPEHAKNAHIFMVRSLCGKWKFPFFCDVDKTFSKEDIFEAIRRFDAAGIKIVSLTCDQGMYTVDDFEILKRTMFWSKKRQSCNK